MSVVLHNPGAVGNLKAENDKIQTGRHAQYHQRPVIGRDAVAWAGFERLEGQRG